MEENAVADYMPAGSDGDVLFGTVRWKNCNAIDGCCGDELECVGALDEQIIHVVGLIVENCCFPPCTLLATPIGEFGCNHWVDVGA